MGGIRRRTGTTAERSARTGAPGQLPGAAVTADLSAETGRSAEADRHRGAGRQNRTAGGGDDPQCHIRGGFPGFQLRIPAGAEPSRRVGRAECGIVRKGVNWIVDADIRGFFDNMRHEWTMRFIQHRVADKRIHRLIQKWLKAGVSKDGEWSETTIGTPQGRSEERR